MLRIIGVSLCWTVPHNIPELTSVHRACHPPHSCRHPPRAAARSRRGAGRMAIAEPLNPLTSSPTNPLEG